MNKDELTNMELIIAMRFKEERKMNINEYQELAMRTNDGKCTERLNGAIKNGEGLVDVGGIINALLGLSGEVGEVTDMIKKYIFHGHEMTEAEIQKEIGDVCWYIAMLCESFGFELDRIMQNNINKLKNRYPEGFSESASINRKE